MEYKFEMGQGKLRVVVPKELDHHLATQLKEEADLLLSSPYKHKYRNEYLYA